MILESIRRRGGSAYAHEVMQDTGMPKTPLYRRLQKLVEMGLLEVAGEPGGRKRFKLKREA